uniref:Uncharacterized protein n=1 Tax=Arundo donax TaxID=35708 RepID=A0A0A9G3A8_ARUDO
MHVHVYAFSFTKLEKVHFTPLNYLHCLFNPPNKILAQFTPPNNLV